MSDFWDTDETWDFFLLFWCWLAYLEGFPTAKNPWLHLDIDRPLVNKSLRNTSVSPTSRSDMNFNNWRIYLSFSLICHCENVFARPQLCHVAAPRALWLWRSLLVTDRPVGSDGLKRCLAPCIRDPNWERQKLFHHISVIIFCHYFTIILITIFPDLWVGFSGGWTVKVMYHPLAQDLNDFHQDGALWSRETVLRQTCVDLAGSTQGPVPMFFCESEFCRSSTKNVCCWLCRSIACLKSGTQYCW